jgi:serine/threonine protein kinase
MVAAVNNKMPSIALDVDACIRASRYATKVCHEMCKRSRLIQNEENGSEESLPVIDREEIVFGELLGRGGFNNVFEVQKIELKQQSKQSAKQQEGRLRIFKNFSPNKYAVKFLNEKCTSSLDDFCNGAADLLIETKYLHALSSYPHPNIIQLHAVAAAGAAGFARGQVAGYFLVIDRLFDTLDRRMDVWKELERRKRKQINETNQKLLSALFLQRIQVALDVASALRHLHRLEVLFRDLKPDNVGFGYDGRVKIFDFGLAKELDPRQKKSGSSNMYVMSGGTGSRRFMAPENLLGEPYGLSADVYSFAILLWEICALKRAFVEISPEEHKEKVILGGQRLPLQEEWSVVVTHLLEGCWQRDPNERPTMNEVYRTLRREITNLQREIISPNCKNGASRRMSM